ncbi:PQQ-dependent sugar dehydrogenase [Microvirga sp. BT689]|uniref:PQQ-dependent sugar dehydrogenase n=1 Tax=Microvirga arvi TaxID=2778731 RepID=UPI00194E9DBB|nr:PQQ-dependent sugar dehydrogenase [Microvirga arvi]MBM6582375.1 PQQ-dependent sugar dehydrogenase [Microvirga arvi]
MAVIYGTSGADTRNGTDQADTIYGYPEAATPPSQVIASGLYRPLFATAPESDTGRLFVASQGGTIKIYDLNNPQATPRTFLDITNKVNNNTEAGLLGFTFHPDFATTGKCYVNYTTLDNTEGTGRKQAIVEYTFDPNDLSKAPTSKTIMIVDYPQEHTHHRAGWLGFGPDGMLYIATGENTVAANAQTVVNQDGTINHLGKILRIDVSGDDFQTDQNRNYSIPDNPTQFDNIAGELAQPSEIWAVGLRNPWRASFGPDGTLYVADVGQNTYEEINIVKAGKNYGWRPAPVADGPQNVEGYTDPYYYGRDIGGSVTGGYFYSGQGPLNGKYIFGDFNEGKIFAMDVSGDEPVVDDITNLFKDSQGNPLEFGHIASFGLDGQGNLYAVSYADADFNPMDSGAIFRLSDNTPVADAGDTLNGAGGDDTIYGGGGDDTIHGGSDNDLVYGDADNDRLYGDRGEDTLRGGDGVDTLEGGDGADVLEGGAGNDVYYVDVDDAVVEAAGGGYDVVHVAGLFYELDEGQEVEEVRAVVDVQVVGLVGNELSQRLVGNAGSNALDGYEGQDTLEGLGGNDTYRVDGNDTVIETEDGGTDTVRSIADYVLGAHLENLQLLENAIKATGNDLKNEITGNDKANVIDGAGGEDTLNGGDGDDTYHVYGLETIEEIAGEGIDTIIFKGGGSYTLGAGIHVEVLKVDLDSGWGNLTGNAFGNKLYSSRGNNALDGGEGDDTVVLSGNRSDYTITLNSDQSFTIEDKRTTGDGRDTVRNVEIFEFADRKVNVKNLLAPTDIILDGDAVTENTKAGELIGQFRVVDNPGDTHRFELVDDAGGRFDLQVVNGVTSLAVKDGVRLDYEQATQHSITVKVTDGAGDSITETIAIRVTDSLNESATGSALGDRILGGSGRDTFSGGAGNDTIDAGAGNDRLTGDAGNDSLTGGAGNDVFSGGDGNERLTGGLGQDTLTGSKGRDVFIFDDRETGSSKTKADYITDFKGREGDRIDLRAVDANTKKSGDQNFSFIGTKAFSKEGQVRYEKAKGYTYVHLNTDADKAAEAVIKLKGAIDLSKGWFVL